MLKWISIVFLAVLLLIGGFFYLKYSYSYSSGYREGILNKFSTKGFVFKTNEGELMMQINQLQSKPFYFSVIDHSVKDKLEQATGKKVKVHYNQYKGSLPWRGEDHSSENKEDGQYIVDEAEIVQ